jgi:hypothetical protein
MRKSDSRGMQKISSKKWKSALTHAQDARRAIKRVPHNRMPDGRKMRTNLVCPPGVQRKFH